MKKILKHLAGSLSPRAVAAIDHAVEYFTPISDQPIALDAAAVQLDRLRAQRRVRGYPEYMYGLLSAARTAKATGADRFTALEFGVAGGNGLVQMETYAALVEQLQQVSIDVVGFDNLAGLPAPTHPRDCAYAFKPGDFPMDESKLRARLQRAELRLGDVAETIPRFCDETTAPVGFVSVDLDFYTSTRDCLALLKYDSRCLLPRVTMYFDDLFGYPYTTVNGEWAAIKEFNEQSPDRQIGQIMGLRHHLGKWYRFAVWPDAMFVFNAFDHPDYNQPETAPHADLSLRG